MTIRAVCPGCREQYSLNDKAVGQPVRCRQCRQVFEVKAEPPREDMVEVVEAEEAPAGAMQTQPEPPRPRAAVAVKPRRTPATVQKSSSAALWWILGGVAAFLLLLLGTGIVVSVIVYLRVRAAAEAEAEARRQADIAFFQQQQQQQQPAVKVDEWNNQNPPGGERQFIVPLLPFVEQPGMPPNGGAKPQEQPVEKPPAKPIVIPQPAPPIRRADPVEPPVKPPAPPPQPKSVLPPLRPSVFISPPNLSADKVTVRLSSNIADVTEGGGGRYLLLHLPRELKIAVFDVSAAKVIGQVPLSEENALFTAGRDKLIVVLADRNIIQRWNLTTFQREAEAPLPVRDKVTAVVMGSASAGPLLVSSAQGASRSELFFMDVATLQKLPIERTGAGHIHIQENDGVRASADGRVFGIWRNQVIPQGIQTLVLEGREAKGYYEHNTAGHLLPGPDGKEIYTAGGRYTSQVKPLGDRRKDPLFCLPAAQPGYFLSVGGEFLSGRSKKGRGPLGVHLAGDERPLATLPEVELPADINIWSREILSIDKRIHFIPSAKLIVTIPGPTDRLVLHRFDVEAALEKTDLEYLLVTSSPRTTAKKGGVYVYQVVVKSKKGGVKSSLTSGPPGMRLTPRGVLVWRVPADFPDDTADVLLTITDASGREVFHKFQIDCRK